MEVLKIQALTKTYHKKKTVLSNFDFSMNEHELVALMGPSGSGKTTLLNLIAGIDPPDFGEILVEGEDVLHLSGEAKVKYRRTKIGLVFQDYHLIENLNVADNIILPMTLEGKPEDEIEERLQSLSREMHITDILSQYPAMLSGGEKQRAAICRALVNQPSFLLADEPTGNLDVAASKNVMEAFVKISSESSILMVTHDAYAASFCNRVAFFSDGKITGELRNNATSQEFFVKILGYMAESGGIHK